MPYDSGNYSTDKKMYNSNSQGHNPNDGENQISWSGNTEGKRDQSISMSAGVVDGLSSMTGIEVKNAERVCPNQRPKGNMMKDGEFEIGVS